MGRTRGKLGLMKKCFTKDTRLFLGILLPFFPRFFIAHDRIRTAYNISSRL